MLDEDLRKREEARMMYNLTWVPVWEVAPYSKVESLEKGSFKGTAAKSAWNILSQSAWEVICKTDVLV